MNRGSFGSVRNLDHETHVLASGSTVDSIRSQIQKVAEEVEKKRKHYVGVLNLYSAYKQKAEGGFCADNYSTFMGKREKCQNKYNALRQNTKRDLDIAKSDLASSKDELNSLKLQLQTKIQAELQLSEQGLTPESAVIQAQSDAKSKQSRNIIIILVISAVVILGFIYAYKVIKAKKIKK